MYLGFTRDPKDIKCYECRRNLSKVNSCYYYKLQSGESYCILHGITMKEMILYCAIHRSREMVNSIRKCTCCPYCIDEDFWRTGPNHYCFICYTRSNRRFCVDCANKYAVITQFTYQYNTTLTAVSILPFDIITVIVRTWLSLRRLYWVIPAELPKLT